MAKDNIVLQRDLIEHLSLIKNDSVLGRVLVKIFRHMTSGDSLDCPPDEANELGFIMLIIKNDIENASTKKRKRSSTKDIVSKCMSSSSNFSPSPAPLRKEKNEKEISPYNPLIEKEIKEKENPHTPSPSSRACEEDGIENMFSEFWELYPRKVARADAAKAFVSMIESDPDSISTMNAIRSALEWQKVSYDWTKENGKYIPYPATWIRAMRWTDPKPDTITVNGKSSSAIAIDNMADEMMKGII